MRTNKSVSDMIDRTSTPAPSFSIVQPEPAKKKGRKKAAETTKKAESSSVKLEKPTTKRVKEGIDFKKMNDQYDLDNFDDNCLWTINVNTYENESTLYVCCYLVIQLDKN